MSDFWQLASDAGGHGLSYDIDSAPTGQQVLVVHAGQEVMPFVLDMIANGRLEQFHVLSIDGALLLAARTP